MYPLCNNFSVVSFVSFSLLFHTQCIKCKVSIYFNTLICDSNVCDEQQDIISNLRYGNLINAHWTFLRPNAFGNEAKKYMGKTCFRIAIYAYLYILCIYGWYISFGHFCLLK